jgi:hypothetical protein
MHTHKTLFKEKDVNYEDYRRIVKKLQRKVVDEICSGKVVKLPVGLGYLFVTGRKSPGYQDGKIILPVNWGATEKLWRENEQAKKDRKRVYMEDHHTDGYYYTVKWMHYKGLRNSMLYKYKSTLQINQALKEAIFSGAQFVNE